MPSIEVGSDKHSISFDINDEVLKPFSLGYMREAFVKLDSILDKVLEYKIRQKFPSSESQKLIEIMAESRANAAFPYIAFKCKAISNAQKDKINKFKAIRNTISHNSIGELDLMLDRKQEDVNTFLKLELEKGIALVKDIAGN